MVDLRFQLCARKVGVVSETNGLMDVVLAAAESAGIRSGDT